MPRKKTSQTEATFFLLETYHITININIDMQYISVCLEKRHIFGQIATTKKYPQIKHANCGW